MDLSSRVALVTGASQGIGSGVAKILAREGATVVVNYQKSRDKAELTVDEIIKSGGQAFAIQADVTSGQEVRRMVAWIVDRFGRIDVLVNNAGVGEHRPFLDITEQSWDEIMAVNLKGVFLCSQAAGRQMVQRRYGKIINISSVVSFAAMSGVAHYCTSKGGLTMLTKAMAFELGPYNINVNAVAPSTVRTQGNARFLDRPEVMQAEMEAIPLHRLGCPEDVGEAVAFLATEKAGWINGTTLILDGGLLARTAQDDYPVDPSKGAAD